MFAFGEREPGTASAPDAAWNANAFCTTFAFQAGAFAYGSAERERRGVRVPVAGERQAHASRARGDANAPARLRAGGGAGSANRNAVFQAAARRDGPPHRVTHGPLPFLLLMAPPQQHGFPPRCRKGPGMAPEWPPRCHAGLSRVALDLVICDATRIASRVASRVTICVAAPRRCPRIRDARRS